MSCLALLLEETGASFVICGQLKVWSSMLCPPGIFYMVGPFALGDGDDVVAPVAGGKICAFGHPDFSRTGDAALGGGGDGV